MPAADVTRATIDLRVWRAVRVRSIQDVAVRALPAPERQQRSGAYPRATA
ncbi:MAG: hypothetical protein IPG81_08170 [Sandaracinaceae bacterium]|nr:hypothetical protein [Sandaracinaceae bacterium]